MARVISSILCLTFLIMLPIICITMIWTDHKYEWEILGTDLILLIVFATCDRVAEKIAEDEDKV